MQYLLTEKERQEYLTKVEDLKRERQQLLGELAEAKGLVGCPAIGNERSEYPCFICTEESRCEYSGKDSYLPK